jgi:linoleoyl-CoA desaturase
VRLRVGSAPVTKANPITVTSDTTSVLTAPRQHRPKFKGNDQFLRELRSRVNAYFETTKKSPRDVPAMYFKTATILVWLVATYVTLVFFVTSPWAVVPLAMLLGLAFAAVGFNIQHDGGHKAVSDRQWVNRLMAVSMDLMGGSSYIWDFKHNAIHHTYTNINGHDDDINVGMLGRLSPEQPRYKFHRLQHVYMWLLYGFLMVKWQLFDDFYQLARGKIGSHRIPRPRGKDLAVFVIGKIFFFSMIFVVPMMLHSVWTVLGVYLIAAFVEGIVTSIVFQLAHCVEEAEFPVPSINDAGLEQMDNAWAVHQVQTTVNFAGRNPVLSWLLGGLNFQIEHHLFHKICHVHYPALSKVVEETCREFGIQYKAHRTFVSALGSHARFLMMMGRPTSSN